MTIKKIIQNINNGYFVTEEQLGRLLKAYKKDGLSAYHRDTRYDEDGYEKYNEWRLSCYLNHSTPCRAKVFTKPSDWWMYEEA